MRKSLFVPVVLCVALVGGGSVAAETNGLVSLESASCTNSNVADIEILLGDHLTQRRILIERALAELKKGVDGAVVRAAASNGEGHVSERSDEERSEDVRKAEALGAKNARIVKALADMQAVEAIPFLVDHLRLPGPQSFGVQIRPPSINDLHPAFDGVVRLGRSSLEAFTVRLGMFSKGDDRTDLAVTALVRILGKDAARAFLLSNKGKAVGYAQALECLQLIYPEGAPAVKIDRSSANVPQY